MGKAGRELWHRVSAKQYRQQRIDNMSKQERRYHRAHVFMLASMFGLLGAEAVAIWAYDPPEFHPGQFADATVGFNGSEGAQAHHTDPRGAEYTAAAHSFWESATGANGQPHVGSVATNMCITWDPRAAATHRYEGNPQEFRDAMGVEENHTLMFVRPGVMTLASGEKVYYGFGSLKDGYTTPDGQRLDASDPQSMGIVLGPNLSETQPGPNGELQTANGVTIGATITTGAAPPIYAEESLAFAETLQVLPGYRWPVYAPATPDQASLANAEVSDVMPVGLVYDLNEQFGVSGDSETLRNLCQEATKAVSQG